MKESIHRQAFGMQRNGFNNFLQKTNVSPVNFAFRPPVTPSGAE
jgi:hypothetical protein